MRIRIVLISLLLLLFAIIAIQNTAIADINLIFWKIQSPLIVLVMVIFLIGLVMGLIVSGLYERRRKKSEELKLKDEMNSVSKNQHEVKIRNKNEIT